DGATRAKVAEALSAHPEGARALRTLAADADASVRANAVWAIGTLALAEDENRTRGLFADPDPAVSGNAVAAYARVASRAVAAAPTLCGLLSDPRPYVRTNALSGLRRLGRRCSGGPERAVLVSDPFDPARAAAARLVLDVP